MGARGKAEAVDMLLHHGLRFLDPLGDFHFLLAGQKRHLAHLFEIHPDWIVQDVELRLRFFFLFLFEVLFNFFMSIDVGCFNHVNFQATKPRKNGVELVCVGDALGQGLV